MKVFLKGHLVAVWEISKTNEQPGWVKEAFAKKYLMWSDNRLRILMSGLAPSTVDNIKIGLLGSITGIIYGCGVYSMGNIGDFLDATNHKIVSKKIFQKRYDIQEV